ncbi:MAG: xanthine dehydrogenase family protein subunit M [Pigmentiphaga sp.]|uniref:FAD binding domain-containing protein n=1 Tax=Pigmentiphaga sp. TaxID=1977564 RepID=UPI0029AF7AAC|nr:xanthine dehydrogenase family protein subunit M [Pigmentiphaga sp.]MDX3905144.1 xanthine dehydrogenase family protein subunit M [Pigmentiphaga sp.]
MKPGSFSYRRPRSVTEALDLLREFSGEAKIIAGGQSLVPAMNLRLAAPGVLVDLGGIPALSELSVDERGRLLAGPMVTHARFLDDPRVQAGWPAIGKVMPYVAHEAIRTRGTLGGSLCHADPAAEWPALCMLLDASMTICGPGYSREVGAPDFSVGVYETALKEGELLAGVAFPPFAPGWRWGFCEISRRHGDFALAGAMAGLRFDAGVIREARLVVFAVEDRPRRMDAALSHLVGHAPAADGLAMAALSAATAVSPRSDLHASADFRQDLVLACVERALGDAAGPEPIGAAR